MIFGNTYKILLRNIFIGGFCIAIFAGALVTFIELKRIDHYVAQISPKEFEKIANLYENFYRNRTKKSLAVLKQATKDSLDHDLFIFVEFIDDKLEKVAQVSIDEFYTIFPQLNLQFGDFEMMGSFKHKTVYYKGQLYLKAMMPVFSKITGETIGHFQGIYHLSEEKLNRIKKQSYYSILLAVIVVFATTILIYPIIRSLHKKLLSRSFELLRSNTDILKSFGSAIAERDSDTSSHNYRVTISSVKLAEKLGLKDSEIRALVKGALLHDVGKIGISDAILLKPGKLNYEEFEGMKQHVAIGAKIIKYNDWLQDALDVVQYHHEKFDGTGYLSGRKGEKIPANARIFAISDVFDALTSRRPYKKAFSKEESLKIMKKDAGRHFDPIYFEVFEQIADDIYMLTSHLDNEAKLNKHLNLILKKYFVLHL